MVMMMIVAPLAALPLAVGGESAPVVTPMFTGGDGSIGDPYWIVNVSDLQDMSTDLTAHYKQVKDIDASNTSVPGHWANNAGAGFMPIGNNTTQFTGSFDGQGYTISNLYIYRPGGNPVGMFGRQLIGSNIGNTTLINADITGGSNTAILIGFNEGTVENCSVNGSVDGSVNVGGVIGENSGTGSKAINCFSNTIIDSYSSSGGIAGINEGTVNNCQSYGQISGVNNLGGLVGMTYGPIYNSNSYVEVFSSQKVAGGLVGSVSGAPISTAVIENCSSYGDVHVDSPGWVTEDYAGGLVGSNSKPIINSSAHGDVYGNVSRIGGLVGTNLASGTIITSYATGDCFGPEVGGLVGDNQGSIDSCYSTGNLTGSSVGGLVNTNTGSESNSFWDIETSGTASSAVGTGKATVEMMQQATFTSAGWDFVDTWHIVEGSSYPVLRWEIPHMFAGGSGTVADPYNITNIFELQSMSFDLGANYSVINDIDATNTSVAGNPSNNDGLGFDPIGDSGSPFNGPLNGRNHSITGLFINRSGEDNVGLFGYADASANISWIFLIDCDISGNNYVGGLAGHLDGTSTIYKSSTTGRINGNAYVGGLVGEHNTGTISNSHASGDVDASGDYAGGLVGNSKGVITDSFATGDVTGGGDRFGGLVGEESATGYINRSYASGNVFGDFYVGGFIGVNFGPINDCYATGNATGSNPVGGFVGEEYNVITNSYSSGDALGSSLVGGFTGRSSGAYNDCFWDNETSSPVNDTGDDGNISSITALNTTDMLNNFTYTNAGWDFDNTWFSVNGSTRPFLRMEWDTEIRNSHQLQLMVMDLAVDYTLANDIDLSDIVEPAQMWGTSAADGKGFVPVGDNIVPFTGSIDGYGYSATGLYINRSTEDYTGLFGYLDTASTVQNLSLLNCYVQGNSSVGVLAGRNYANITNCSTDGEVNGTGYNVGGFIGWNEGGTIMNSHSTGNASGGNWNVGGFVGTNYNFGQILNCSSSMTVIGTTRVGGFAGYNWIDGTIINSYSTGNVNGTGDDVGGFAGRNRFVIFNSTSSGNVGGNSNTGGFIGLIEAGSTVFNCTSNGTVDGTSYVGGFAGKAESGGGTIENCTAYGNTTGSSFYVAGFIGMNYQSIANCTAYGTIDSGSSSGGLIGRNDGAVTNCTAYGDVYGTNTLGGLIGYANAGAITNCTAYGNTTTSNGDKIGGLIGSSRVSVTNCTSYGNAIGTDQVGGLIGRVVSGTVMNGVSYGYVTGSENHTGGLIGYNLGNIVNSSALGNTQGNWIVGGLVGENGGSIATSYSIGTAQGTTRIGGFAGINNMNGNISNCYSQGDVTGSADYVGGFAGINEIGGGIITNSYSSGAVTGNVPVGGFCGDNTDTITDCFWDTETSGQSDISGATGNTTMEMMQQATFTNWDFTNVWGIHEANTYPFLLPFGVPPEPVADMEITLTDSVDPATVGDVFSYFVTLENHGPDNAADIYINVTLPAEVTYHSANQTGLIVNGRYITALVPVFENGEIGGIQINVTLDSYSASPLNCTAFLTSPTLDPGVFANETHELTETNRAPVVVDDDVGQTTEDDIKYIWPSGGILSNDNDPDGDNITVSSYETASLYGAAVTIDLADGNLTYDPTVSAAIQALHMGDFINDTFNYTITDGRGGFATAMIYINVSGNEGVPTANNDTFTIAEDSGPHVLDVLANDVGDEEGDAFNITSAFNGTHGTVTISTDGLNLTYEQTHTNYTGYDVFTYWISDGVRTSSATVNMTITPINDAPYAQGNYFAVDEDSGPYTLYVLAPAIDAEGDDLTITVVTQPDNGIIVITENGKNLTYEPDADFYGDDYFNYTISDGNGGTDTMMVRVQVNSVNDLPAITTTVLDDGIVGVEYSFVLEGTDLESNSSILGWGGTSDAGWLTIQATGLLGGIPTEAGTFWVNISVNDGNGGIVFANLTLTITDPASETDTDDDGVPDDQDAFPNDATETTDTDGDGVGDNADAFPTDPAASVDADGDGMPDEWNDGYTADNSTTGLVLDDIVEVVDGGDDEPANNLPYIILILVVVGVIAGLFIMKGKGGKPEAADEPMEESGTEEPEAPVEDVPEENATEDAPEEIPDDDTGADELPDLEKPEE